MSTNTGQIVRMQLINRSNMIDGYGSEQDDRDLHRAFTILKSRTSGNNNSLNYLTLKTLAYLQAIVTQHQTDMPDIYHGRYRYEVVTSRGSDRSNIELNGVLVPNHATLQKQLLQWFSKYAVATENFDPKVAHIEFEKLKPFMVANGRVGRLILWWHQQAKGLPIEKLTSRSEYMSWFTEGADNA